jgi:hypothetical protein
MIYYTYTDHGEMNEPNETIQRHAINDHTNRATTILYGRSNYKRWNTGIKKQEGQNESSDTIRSTFNEP